MKVVLVDDEKFMLLIMRRMISKIPDIEVVGSFQSPNEAYLFLKENKVSIVFVDINMPEENGLDFARRVSREVKDIAIFFLTAHKEYALEAFELHAFDYIVKPVSQEKLENSILIAKERLVFLQESNDSIRKPKLSINFLGSMEIWGTSNEMVHFTSTKSIELLSYLVIKKGRFASKWNIIDDVFGGMPPHNAETYLNTTIYKLRKALEPYDMKSAIVSGDESYRIEMKYIYADFMDFENRLTSHFNIHSYNQAEVLQIDKVFRGELFGDKDYYWSYAEKERITELYINFAKKTIEYLLESNLLTEALHIAKKIININEFDEEANCILMKIYSALRNRILLERQYQLYTEILERELGITPGNLVVKLYKELIKSFQ